ncbi:MAG: C45 family peptidase [Pirellulaceae bacterium]|nr:C45 family peptidase [Pirellulaceae bacterium]
MSLQLRPQYWLISIALGWSFLGLFQPATLANDGTERPVEANATNHVVAADFSESFAPLLEVVSGAKGTFELTGTVSGHVDGQVQRLELRFAKWDEQAFELELTHPDYSVAIYRRPQLTAFALPKHQVVFVANGDLQGSDHLELSGITERLISRGSVASTFAPMVFCGDPKALAGAIKTLLDLSASDEPLSWLGGDGTELKIRNSEDDSPVATYVIEHRQWQGALQVAAPPAPRNEAQLREQLWANWKHETLDRDELERTLSRGLRRALEVLLPSPSLINPRQTTAKVEHGELRWVENQRLVLLSGTPEQIGHAHGQLLKTQSMACIDSVLHAFGAVQTIQTGRWFRSDLEAAYKRLRTHIPEDHLIETRALAKSLELPIDTMEVLNVFPELFHCSGFAVFGDATVDGKLYHGRVLDYMTMIGLQDAATTFVIAVDGKIPFATVGYAGFIGSVSGMNQEQVSLGEMGGRGEGQWDGVPMATLMRRGLEECHTLQEVIDLWSNNPRTCEYYYVFADGKDRSAVGVAATPEKVEFVYPGQAHPLLGEGIKDTVLLSAGDRLNKLRARVQESYGKIDKQKAQWLMSRPVAMSSNLHNVLFVPEDGLFQVANASHNGPAAEQPYVEYNLRALVLELQSQAQPVLAK